MPSSSRNSRDLVREMLVVKYYRSDMPVGQVMELAGITPATLYKILQRNNVPLRQPRGAAKYANLSREEKMDQLVSLVSFLKFDEGKDVPEIAVALEESEEFIQAIIEERL